MAAMSAGEAKSQKRQKTGMPLKEWCEAHFTMCYAPKKDRKTKEVRYELSVPHSPYNIGTGNKIYYTEGGSIVLTVEDRKIAAVNHICAKFFLCDSTGAENPELARKEARFYIERVDPIFSDQMFSNTRTHMNWDIVRGSTGDKPQGLGESKESWGRRVAIDELREESGLNVDVGTLTFLGARGGRDPTKLSRYVYTFRTTAKIINETLHRKINHPNTAAMGKCPHNYLEKGIKGKKDTWRKLKSDFGETDEGVLLLPHQLTPGLQTIENFGVITIDRKLADWNNDDWSPKVDEGNLVAPSGVAVFVYDEHGRILVLCGDRGKVKCYINIQKVELEEYYAANHGGGGSGGGGGASKFSETFPQLRL